MEMKKERNVSQKTTFTLNPLAEMKTQDLQQQIETIGKINYISQAEMDSIDLTHITNKENCRKFETMIIDELLRFCIEPCFKER